ncbi:hypothetical protein Tco_1152030 [Tanacetum coccineum]
MDVAIINQGASIKALEIQIGEMSKVLQKRGSRSLPGLTETNPRDHVKSILIILNRSLDPVYEDYIKLKDLNEPLELRRNQVEDLGLTIEEGEVIDEPMEDIVKTRNDDNEISNGIDEYPSFCDFDRKIHIDCAYNLQFSCMIGFEHVNVNFFPILSINVMSKSSSDEYVANESDFDWFMVANTDDRTAFIRLEQTATFAISTIWSEMS